MAASLEGVLASIPGLGGYNAQSQFDQNQALKAVQQVAGLQALQQHMVGAQREAQMRAELQALGPNPSQEALFQIGAKYASAGDLLKSQTSSLDRKASIEATKATALARLQETARMNDSLISHRISQEQDANRRAALMEQQAAMRNYYNERAQAIAGEKLFYETGVRLPQGTPPVALGTPQAVAAPQTVGGVPNAAQAALTIPEADRAAFEAARSGLGQGGATGTVERPLAPGELANGAVINLPDRGPTPAPQPIPLLPAGTTYPDAQNLDARDIRSRESPAPTPAKAPTKPNDVPAWIQEIKSPKLREQSEARWRLMQDRQNLKVEANNNPPQAVKNLAAALEKANLPTADAVLSAVEDRLKKTPGVAEYITGPKSVLPDWMIPSDAKYARQEFQKLFNITLKDRSGAAVTNQELERLKQEFAAGVFKTSDQLNDAVRQARNIIQRHYISVAAGFGPEALVAYNNNLKFLGGKPVLEPGNPGQTVPSNTAAPKTVNWADLK